MRVTQFQSYQNIITNVNSLNERLARLSQELSSGKKLLKLSDSPTGSSDLIGLSEQASEIDQFRSNADSSLYLLGITESTLNEVQNLITSIYSSGSEASSDFMSPDARATLAGEIRSMRDQIFSLANSQVDGRYIFAGSQTDQAPFTIAGDVVTYNGDDDVNTVYIDKGQEVQQNYSGSTVFTPLFNVINNLLAGMDINDVSSIRTALTQFASALSGLNQIRGEVGTGLEELQNAGARLTARETSLTEKRSRIEDADTVKVTVELSQAQTTLKASVSAAGTILSQPNLFDILG